MIKKNIILAIALLTGSVSAFAAQPKVAQCPVGALTIYECSNKDEKAAAKKVNGDISINVCLVKEKTLLAMSVNGEQSVGAAIVESRAGAARYIVKDNSDPDFSIGFTVAVVSPVYSPKGVLTAITGGSERHWADLVCARAR